MSIDPTPLLSLVIVAYDMSRQLVRTVKSLSPSVQRSVDVADYELIVVDNGSRQPIDREICEAAGSRLRWIRIDDAPPSPAQALNAGVAAASGSLVGAMIDGARMASPGLLEQALTASRVHPRPVIATLGFHLGHEPQQLAVRAGYDEDREAELLDGVEWEGDGYRLFEISVLGLSSAGGWLDVPAESNAIFMPSDMWRELGGFDEGFRSPGGGLVNLDLFARACDLPGSRLIMLLGEATFHQVHGGVSTNDAARRFPELLAEYEQLRGRPYTRPTPQALFLGTLSPQARASLERSVHAGFAPPTSGTAG